MSYIIESFRNDGLFANPFRLLLFRGSFNVVNRKAFRPEESFEFRRNVLFQIRTCVKVSRDLLYTVLLKGLKQRHGRLKILLVIRLIGDIAAFLKEVLRVVEELPTHHSILMPPSLVPGVREVHIDPIEFPLLKEGRQVPCVRSEYVEVLYTLPFRFKNRPVSPLISQLYPYI